MLSLVNRNTSWLDQLPTTLSSSSGTVHGGDERGAATMSPASLVRHRMSAITITIMKGQTEHTEKYFETRYKQLAPIANMVKSYL